MLSDNDYIKILIISTVNFGEEKLMKQIGITMESFLIGILKTLFFLLTIWMWLITLITTVVSSFLKLHRFQSNIAKFTVRNV